MVSEEYLKRVEGQRKWYSGKSSKYKKLYQYSCVIKVVFIGLIPIVSLVNENINCTKYLIPILSFGALITESVQSIFQYHENWTNYRCTSEALKKEQNLYKTKSGVYRDTPESMIDNMFVERCEDIISNENSKWVTTTKFEIKA